MPFTGNENHAMSLEDAAQLTKNYRDSVSAGTMLGGFFGKTTLLSILNQTGCVGMRIYNAVLGDGMPTYVLVGVDSPGEDMEDGVIAEIVIVCPPICPKESTLAGTAGPGTS
jgi:hypothetical protein